MLLQVRLMSLNRFLLADVSARLSKEWPTSFSQAYFDSRGFLVAAFDAHRASSEGDVLGYMNRRAPPPLCQFNCSSFCRPTTVFAAIASACRLTRHVRFSKLDDDALAKFKLKRDVKTWGSIAGARVLFAWRPPWVKASLVELYYNMERSSGDDAAVIAAGSDGSPSRLQKLKPERESLLFAERSKTFGRVRRSAIGLPFRGPLLTCALGFD
jgi:hypothetical protein